MPYDDDYGDGRYDDGPVQPTLAGMYGFIIAMVSLGLLGVVTALWFLLQEENPGQANDRMLWMFWGLVPVPSIFSASAAP